MHGGTLNLPCGTVVSARIGTVNRNELWDTGADKGHFARSTPPFARGADLSGNRYVIHRNPLALSRPQRPAGSSLLWEETIPAPRFRRGDWYARRENPVRGRKDTRAHAPPAHVSTTCADSNQMITSLPADQRQTFSTARKCIRTSTRWQLPRRAATPVNLPIRLRFSLRDTNHIV